MKQPKYFTETFATEDEMVAALNSKKYAKCKVINFVHSVSQGGQHYWIVLFERK